MEAGKPLTILHLFSNHKWTGPAEPAVNLAVEQKRRGHRVLFAPGTCPDDGSSILRRIAAERGLAPLEGLTLAKHRTRRTDAADAESLQIVISKETPDVIHAHMDNDHEIAVRAAGMATHAPALVRTLYHGEPSLPRRLKWLLARTDGLLVLGRAVRDDLLKRGAFDPARTVAAEGTVDVERFRPRPKNEALAADLGIIPDDFVVGIVARVQRHRRFEVFLEAARIALEKDPNLKFMIVGRGTHREELVIEPVRRLGLTDRFVFTGYRGDDYIDTVNLFDVKVFLVPGSDGTCRAMRELMALGKPVIAARRGMLEEIVDDGHDGLLIEDSPQNLAGAILRLAADREGAVRMGARAANKAAQRFALPVHADRAKQVYDLALAAKQTEGPRGAR